MKNANFISWSAPKGDICPVFMREFNVADKIKKATLFITARGVYEAKLNGNRVGDFIMAPGWTSYDTRLQVQKYDITNLVATNNRIEVILSDGWFAGLKSRPLNKDKVAFIAKIVLEYINGTTEEIITDENWYVSESKVRFCDIYDGEIFDATITPVFNEKAVINIDNDKSNLIEQLGDFVTEQELVAPVNIFKTPKGETVIDFGQNLTGYLEIKLTANAGDIAELSFGEVLDKDGNFYNENYRSAKAIYKYICKDGAQVFKPINTFYGFRYVRVDKFPDQITADKFNAIVVHSNMKKIGKIETSNPLLNKLVCNIIWSQKGNFLDVPTDCPQRDERLGWTGDAMVFMRTACLNFDCRKFFKKWLLDMKAEQLPNGAVKVVVPRCAHKDWFRNDAAGWSDAIVICPWEYYLIYGDTEILKIMFEPMKKWVNHIADITEKPNLWFGGFQYGDWLELSAKDGEFKGDTRDNLVASAFYANSVNIVCKVGKILGEDVSNYEKLYSNIVAAFKTEFNDNFKTQTEHILALNFNLCIDETAVIKSLTNLIHSDGDMLKTGFLGTPYILRVLSNNGYTDLAYTLLLREEYPSWLYPVTKGATTIWEHWDGIKPDGSMWSSEMNSFNHYAYGSVADWLYGVAGGIIPDKAGFEKVRFAPKPDKRLDWFKAELDTDYGKISSYWYYKDGKVNYEIETPVNAKVEIDGNVFEITKGKHRF